MNSTTKSKEFEQIFLATLSDYVTSVAWSPTNSTLAAVSAAGEVALWQDEELEILQPATDKSVDCVAFSHDGQFLAVGGQDGQVKIWRENELVATLENAPAWVDKLIWIESSEAITTLNFEDSSPLGIDWRGNGKHLAIGGNKGVKIWNCLDWDEEPYVLEMPTVSLALAWSSDCKYLASGNMDRSVTVLEWGNPEPWVMRGFPGKIRQVTWSDINTPIGAPILATSSVEGMVVWEKAEDESVGWEAQVLTNHVDIIQGIGFAPNSFLLASAASDGWLCLWKKAKNVSQVLTGVPNGYSSLAWHPQGKLLAAGGDNGEIQIWSRVGNRE